MSEHKNKGVSPLTPGVPALVCAVPPQGHLWFILSEMTCGLFLVRLRVSAW